MPVKRHFLLLLLVVIVSVLAGLYAFRPEERGVYFYDKSDNKVTLDDFKGKVVLVNLWATWCLPCIAELPSLNRLQDKWPQDKFSVVAISLDNKISPLDLRSFLDKHGAKGIDVYHDKDRQIRLKWKYAGLPTSFLIDREGIVVRQYNGAYDWDNELKDIRALLP